MKKATFISRFPVVMIAIFLCILVYSTVQLFFERADMFTLKQAERKESLPTASFAELFFSIFYHPILSH